MALSQHHPARRADRGHAPLRHAAALGMALLFTAALSSCRQREQLPRPAFTTDRLNPYTPVKDQGHNQTCWIFAMLAAIETEHLGRGDSVNLSPYYAERQLLETEASDHYLTRGRWPLTMRGTAARLISLIGERGIVPYDAYRYAERTNTTVTCRLVRQGVMAAVRTGSGLDRCRQRTARLLDEQLGPEPRRVFMLGAEYTPQEFARSVCAPGEYEALTSFTHHPFHTAFALEVPDNIEHHLFYNIPVDSLLHRVEQAVARSRGVCWEGDISEPGFSFARGTATLPPHTDTSQQARQRAFERGLTTDDHCMAIVGTAHDARGERYFILKNSWGTANPYGGLMYMSEDYVRLKTVAVYLPKN